MAITPWLHYAGHLLAPTCRSQRGSITPVGDTANSESRTLGGPDVDIGLQHAGVLFRYSNTPRGDNIILRPQDPIERGVPYQRL